MLTHSFSWKKVSMAAAICYGVRGGAQLAFPITAGNYDTDTLIEVLGELRRFLGGEKATLLWDGLPPTAATRCGPGWQPSGLGWWWSGCPPTPRTSTRWRGCGPSLKAVELANLVSTSLAEVIDQAHRGIDRVRRTPHLASSLLRRTGLSVS